MKEKSDARRKGVVQVDGERYCEGSEVGKKERRRCGHIEYVSPLPSLPPVVLRREDL